MKPILPPISRARLGVLLAGLLAISLSAFAADPAVEPPGALPAVKLAAEAADPLPPPPPPPTAARPKFREKSPHEQRVEIMGVSIGLISVVLGIGIGFFAIGCDFRKRQQLLNLCHQERMAALEKGLELPPFPPEFGRSPDGPDACGPKTGLKAGLIWLAIGLGLVCYLSVARRAGTHPSVGAIPIAIGAAYLIYYAIEGRKLIGRRPPRDDQ